MDWTPEQAAIIGHPLGAHALVHAAPGAGKTTTLVGRVARLVEQADVGRIRVVMFNKAIQETFAERLERAGCTFRATWAARWTCRITRSTFSVQRACSSQNWLYWYGRTSPPSLATAPQYSVHSSCSVTPRFCSSVWTHR